MPTLICPDCNLQMRPTKTGQPVELMSDFGSYQFYSADKYGCPKCGKEVAFMSNQTPISEHYRSDYQETVASYEAADGPIIHYWANEQEKARYEAGELTVF